MPGQGETVLCLAARIGTEVKAFQDFGSFAVGIDLNPGAENPYVMHGDFHDLKFSDNCVDTVFTNSLDHALYPDRVFSEVRRVLKPTGRFILEIMRGEQEGYQPREYEVVSWSKVDDIVSSLERQGLTTEYRTNFEYPWKGGEHIVFKKKPGTEGAL